MITDFKSLIELIKNVLPFAVCVITFISTLFLYKIALKTNRKNPLIYILSIASVVCLYFTFIDIVGLGRYDYFLDGVRLFLRQFKGILAYCVFTFFAVLTIIKSIDMPILIYTIFSIVWVVSMFLNNIDYLYLKAKYICALILDFRFKALDHLKLFFSYSYNAVNKIHILNCIFNC